MATLKFRFDKRIPEEAALLDHLRSLPEDRHIEYVRNLALKAFRQERAESRQSELGGIPPVSEKPDATDGAPRPDQAKPKVQSLQPTPSREELAASEISLASLKQMVG
jgi:hypothetical protein